MLDRKSLPVWMLADFAIVVATTEMVAGVCIVASIGSHLIGQREKTIRIRYDKLAVEKSELEEALIVAREVLAVART